MSDQLPESFLHIIWSISEEKMEKIKNIFGDIFICVCTSDI